MTDSDFAARLLAWHSVFGRHDLPWQRPRTMYRVWLSEIMLQQTQVQTVIPYFENFLERFPELSDLAAAPSDAVMSAWAGLGYYSRARNLHKAAQWCMIHHNGRLPEDYDALLALPGIGRSTAGAILSQACGARHAIVDGNVKRVLTRYFAIAGDAASTAVDRQLWQLAERLLPEKKMADYSQAIMDLGATVCTSRKPQCTRCPLAQDCRALAQGNVLDYPGRKPAKSIPERETHVLLLRTASGEILLEQRPDKGIWGGLYSLPEAGDTEQASTRAEDFISGNASAPLALPAFAHTFSHFRLIIQPLLWDACTAKTQIRDNARMRWATPDELPELGLPAPIQKLLKRLP
ncbi:A/G-specific adenine glycosylase [Arenimonas sp. GDDSR-1]|uniref:A/G-specific adenine glycosylase n=1 Tax=Arenimonas sp. GDDSR-1 TaxID=2950125 RepID=UPI00262F7FB5|nr:A/G-specific adenine glycosylase [Arenimonas sp. GDDSR-1]